MNATDLWNKRPPFLEPGTPAEKWAIIERHTRRILADTAWAIDADNSQEWKDYRKDIHDIRKAAKQGTGNPDEVVFPDPPDDIVSGVQGNTLRY